MAEIYNVPENIKVPKLNFSNFNLKEYEAECDAFKEEIRKQLKEANPDDEHCGKVIRFPVADGHAEYMVFTVNPVQLVHLPLGDEWEFQYAENLTPKNVLEKIRQQEALDRLFSKTK